MLPSIPFDHQLQGVQHGRNTEDLLGCCLLGCCLWNLPLLKEEEFPQGLLGEGGVPEGLLGEGRVPKGLLGEGLLGKGGVPKGRSSCKRRKSFWVALRDEGREGGFLGGCQGGQEFLEREEGFWGALRGGRSSF